MCVLCVLFPDSARTAPGEITILLADAVIGSQEEDALHSLVSTAVIPRLYSLFLFYYFCQESCFFAPGSWFVCLSAGYLTNLMNRLPEMWHTGLRSNLLNFTWISTIKCLGFF